jgi:hypothetical protein
MNENVELDLIRQLQEITAVCELDCRKILEAHHWNLKVISQL